MNTILKCNLNLNINTNSNLLNLLKYVITSKNYSSVAFKTSNTKLHPTLLQQTRLKFTKIQKENVDLEELTEKFDKDGKIIITNLNSLRIDLVLKSGLNLARNKIEKAFYESRIRVNEKKITKKSQQLQINDEVDLIKGVSNNNSKFLIVGRVIILSVNEDELENKDNGNDKMTVKLKRYKSLMIENYSTDPWKPISE